MQVRLISWNTAGRKKRLHSQLEFLRARNPDLATLQEVPHGTGSILRTGVREVLGLEHVLWSLDGCPKPKAKNRGLGVLVGSRFPFQEPSGKAITSPWPEKAISLTVQTPWGPLDLHTVHIPPGSSNGWAKVAVLESVFTALSHPRKHPSILTGDLNTPQLELPSGEIVTWAQRLDRDGRPVLMRTKKGGDSGRWDRAERNILKGLTDFGLRDAFRAFHGPEVSEKSWVAKRSGREFPRRFDHAFLSDSLQVTRVSYLHQGRTQGLSDHSPLEVHFLMAEV